jgi:transcriptional regulator with XRE-family HTH domain
MHTLKQLRLALGLTQSELGKSIGITEGRICHVENRRGNLGAKALLRLTERYRSDMVRMGITVEDLIRGSRGEAA